MPRLRRSDPHDPGIVRTRHGRGFAYRLNGEAVGDEALTRIRDLAIPPAWTDVWICPDELGHLQAVGLDAAGRKQYLYHPLWRERRDREKFDRMLDFARRLPSVRRARRSYGGAAAGRSCSHIATRGGIRSTRTT